MKRLELGLLFVIGEAEVQCLSEELVARFVEARLRDEELAPIDQHLDNCEECRMVIAAVAGTMPAAIHAEKLPPAPTLGRYVVLDIVGEGAMGIVYSAYDPKLDRKVAIKLLHAEANPSRSGEGPSRQERFLREGRAMARLVHPNVVAVHDTGSTEGQVFVAMEYVDGWTLREWMTLQKRGVDDVLDCFRQAGCGLAAAHKAGIVHRDFKPDNVLVSREGVVKVGDFGLVSFSDAESGQMRESNDVEERDRSLADSCSDELNSTVTQTGTRLGTALYMSPEQYDAADLSASTDQFSFCAALYEALCGVPPFAGNTGLEIRRSIHCQTIAAQAPGREVPAWLLRIVLQGLKEDPKERHVSMEALLTALAADPARARKRLLMGTAAALALVIPSFLLFASASSNASDKRASLCTAPTAELRGVWDDEQRALLDAAFATNPSPRAAETAKRVSASFDSYRNNWLEMRVQACEATHVQGHQSEHLLDVRVHCLDRRRSAFAAFTALFIDSAPETAFLDRAANAALGMPALDECSDVETLLNAPSRPREQAKVSKLSALEARFDQVVALEHVGNFQEALLAAEPLAEEARQLNYPPFYAQALFELSVLNLSLAHYDASEQAIPAIVQAAATGADDVRAADAWLLLQSIAVSRPDYDEALRLQPWVEAAIVRSGDKPRQRAKLATNQATVFMQRGKYSDAEASYQIALDLLTQQDQPDPSQIALLHSNLGLTAFTQSKLEEAHARFAQALALQEQTLGPNHPEVARTFLQMCLTYNEQAQFDKAEQTCTRSLRIREDALGRNHPSVAHPLNVLAHLARRQNDLSRARELYERALSAEEHGLDAMHPTIATTLTNLGDLLVELGDFANARAAAACPGDSQRAERRSRRAGADSSSPGEDATPRLHAQVRPPRGLRTRTRR